MYLSVCLTLPSPCKATRLLPRADAIVYRQHAYTQGLVQALAQGLFFNNNSFVDCPQYI